MDRLINFVATRKRKKSTVSDSISSKYSVAYLNSVLDKLKHQCRRESTYRNYYGIWKNFNNFIIKLDLIPRTWEERTSLYVSFLVEECQLKSTTVRSYISAIKAMLQLDDYPWQCNELLLSTLTKTCRLINDVVRTRLPIKKHLMELILDKITDIFTKEVNQPFLAAMYRAAVVICYYGLLRIGEIAVTASGHTLKAKDIHLAVDKKKLLLVLYSSKTHGKAETPQQIKIEANNYSIYNRYQKSLKGRKYCPFIIINHYLKIRGGYREDDDSLFVFQDYQSLQPAQFRKVLKRCIQQLGLNKDLYDTHSLRGGRASDLLKLGNSVEQIKRLGRWKSNAVYKYLKFV